VYADYYLLEALWRYQQYTQSSSPVWKADDVYQYSVPVGNRTAFLWIPPQCRHIRGVIIAMENALELNWMEDPVIRETAAKEGLGMIWLADGKPTDINFEMKPAALSALDKMFHDLAVESGYAEIEKAPLIVTGHSWNGRMAWNYPNARPERVIAAVPIRTYPMPDSLKFSGIPLCYIVGQTTELPEYGDGRPGDRDFFWPIVRQTAVALRTKNEDNLIGVVTYPGGCHMDWNEEQSHFLAMFIHKACEYRLPANYSKDRRAVLREIPHSSGWLTDTGGMDADTFAPAPYKKYRGDPKKAYWFFDEEMARAAVAFNGDRKKRALQMVSFVQRGDTLPVALDGYVKLKCLPEDDGLTYKVTGGFLKEKPAGLAGAGLQLGHADGFFTLRVVMGPARQVSPDQFRLQFTRQAPRNIMILAEQAGDGCFRRALQPGIITIPCQLTEGAAQSVDFPCISDQVAGVKALALRASSSSGLPVNYYVVAGPAIIDGDTLRLTEIPIRSRYPVKVTIVAYQWGRMTAPKIQSAIPVTRDFYLTDLSAIDRKIAGWVDSGYYSGASLVVGRFPPVGTCGETGPIYEKYFGNYKPGTVAYIASAGKWLAAATIAAVVDEGLLSWDDKVKKWLPAFTDPKGEATLRQLLAHTAGYPDYQPNGRHPDNYSSLQESVSHIIDLPADTMPGAVFHYGGLAMQVAGRMAELATGKDWETLFREKIAGPLDMSSTHFVPVDTTQGHNPMLGGGARTTLSDYAHFLQMIAGDGMYNGRRILSAAVIREMQKDQVGTARVKPGEFVARVRGRSASDIYGLGEWREEVNERGEPALISSPGWAGAYPWIDKNNKVYGFFLARVNVEKANAGHFTPFYCSAVLSMLVRKSLAEEKTNEHK
jgi:CubicO group peptidase (beta-lactamase class C family)